MQSDIIEERSAMERMWSKREKQLQTVVQNVAGVIGDLQGTGVVIEKVKRLELPGSD